MSTQQHPVTTAEAVHRAVEVCEIGEVDDRLGDLLARFEDADEPIRAIGDVELRLDEVLEAIAPDWENLSLPPDSSLAMARAVAVYLAFRRDEIDSEATTLLRLAARAEYHGVPPAPIRDWLGAAGVSL
ncbi:MAG TPA: hypothetical protein VGN08_09765 [Solirubrobacteraceae bacterium]|jgi:hypothetical protein